MLKFSPGTVVDIGKLLTQLERSKQEKFDSESRLDTTQQIVANLKESAAGHHLVKGRLEVGQATFHFWKFLFFFNSDE